MAMQGPPPPATGMKPQDYYFALVRQGMSPYQAYQAVQANFGPPPSQEDINKANAKNQQMAAIGGTVGTVGGALATKYVLDNAGKWINSQTGEVATPKVTQVLRTNYSNARPGTQVDVPASTSTTPTGSNVSAQPVTEVGSVTMPDGTPGKLMSDGGKVGDNGKIVNPDGSNAGQIQGQALAGLQIAGGAAQMYNGYKQYQSGEKLGGAANVAGGAYATAAGAQSLAAGGTAGSLAQYAPAVGTAVAAAQIGQQMISDEGASEDRAARSEAEAQKAALLWVPGYGWVAYAAIAGLDAVTGGKATEWMMTHNKFGHKITDKIDFGLGKSIRSKLFHQSTKGVQKMHTGQLLQQSDDPNWQNYVAGMRIQQVNEGPKDKTKPFYNGQYATFDEYKKAGLQADDLTGVYGNLDAFKPDYAEKAGVPNWANLSFEQRKAVTQRLIDENMYSSKKGEVVIGDKEKARRIYEEMAQTNFNGQPSGNNQSNPQTRPPAPLPPNTSMNPMQTANKPRSMREILQSKMNK